MSAESILPKKIHDASNLTNVTLASEHDKGQSRKNMTNLTNVALASGDDKVIYACNICDKSYDKKSSYHSHMRTKHKAAKETDVEKGKTTTQKNKAQGFHQWIENEVDRPMLLTRDLDSFLANESDASLVGAMKDSEEVAVEVEKLSVRNHEVEWFEENNMEEFTEEFASQFASSLRRESLLPKQLVDKLASFHNDLLKTQQEKYDNMVVKTTQILNAAETAKSHLRKTAKALQKELEETRENWQGSAEADAKELSSLRATVTVQKTKIQELEFLNSEPQVANQKCEKCKFIARDSQVLGKHMKQVHGQGINCANCSQVFDDKTKLSNHMGRHHKKDLYVKYVRLHSKR